MHDASVCQRGVYDRAVEAIAQAKARGFRVNINCTLFNTGAVRARGRILRHGDGHGHRRHHGIAGYAYERAPDQQHFLNRDRTKQLFRGIFQRGPRVKKWALASPACSSIFSPVTRAITARRGAIRPARSSAGKALLPARRRLCQELPRVDDETDWDSYGTGNYEKCADCMVHCGYEASAVQDAITTRLRRSRSPTRPKNRRRHGSRDQARSSAPCAVHVLTACRAETR